jgi:hypothetical protein
MSRKTASAIRVDPNVRALRIYPVEGTAKSVETLKTVGIKLSREQAVHLARVLLAMSQDHSVIDITGYRFERRRADNTSQVTVTAAEA